MTRFFLAVLLSALALTCGTIPIVSASMNAERQLEVNPLLNNWAKEEGLANLLNEKIESSTTSSPTKIPTNSPTSRPTNHPTKRPTASPTVSPSETPTQNPTLNPTVSPSNSWRPSGQPSMNPTAHPSAAPSTSLAPTTPPSSKPTVAPSNVPSISQEPTRTPSLYPSTDPTMKPSSGPSNMLSFSPSMTPSLSPSEPPTKSTTPSQQPTEIKAMESSIIIDRSKTRNATPLLVVGACCFIIMASTSIYLYMRGSMSRLEGSAGAPSIIEVSSSKHGGGNISPYSAREGLGPGHDTFDVKYSESESRISDEGTLEYNCTSNEQCLENNVDLETGRIGIDSIPNSVSIIKRARPSQNADENSVSKIIGSSRLRMPKSIYVPKMFQRTREGDDNNKETVTWDQIREEDRSHASSGYAPASVPSAMVSPFVVKGLSSILSPYSGMRGIRGNCSDQKEGSQAAATQEKSSSKESKVKGGMHVMAKSPLKEIVVKREAPSPCDSIFAGLENVASRKEQKSPKTVDSKSSDGSSIEWGIDVPKVHPSKASFEANVNELQNLLVSIKSLGSSELPTIADNSSPKSDVPMTYTDDSWESHRSGKSLHIQQNSPKSNSLPYHVDNIDIAPMESSSTQGNVSTRTESSSPQSLKSPPNTHNESGITFEVELLNSNRMGGDGTFSFRNIFNDPKNDLYECHAPSGPLGIVVDTTPLGPRVRSLNPLSPIFGKVSPGDVVVGVDEVDTVGMEAGDFWQIVSRKANQQKRILTILRI